MPKLFLSHRLDLLTEHLANEIAKDGRGIFAPRIILVPGSFLKQWVLVQVAARSEERGIAGCKVMSLYEAVQKFLAPSGFTEIFFALYSALIENNHPEIRSYLGDSPRRTSELANLLTRLFVRYGHFCPSLFQGEENWQKQLIQSLFANGRLRLLPQVRPIDEPPIHLFGFDYLFPLIWRSFHFSSISLFSPCRHYWEDLCTDRERKRLGRFWRQKGASPEKREELDAYLKNAPPLLANWGRIGRETLKILDGLDCEIEEDYRLLEKTSSTLSRFQRRLLDFTFPDRTDFPEDSSIRISKTGSSLLKEIEHLRSSILRLVIEERLLFSDIAVLAPDIQPYASFIQFVFSDLPFRIFGLEIGKKSSFYQGLHRLLELCEEDLYREGLKNRELSQEAPQILRPERAVFVSDKAPSEDAQSGVKPTPGGPRRRIVFGGGAPDKTDFSITSGIMPLLENPSFQRARGWTFDLLEEMRQWVSVEEERLLDQVVYLYPNNLKIWNFGQEDPQNFRSERATIAERQGASENENYEANPTQPKTKFSSCLGMPEQKKTISNEVLEELIEIRKSLRADFALLMVPHTLSEWANLLLSLAQKYFFIDLSDEADAASWRFFKQTLKELDGVDSDSRLFPIESIRVLLRRSIPEGQVHASHLHAIRFGSLSQGSLVPVRALFLIGMDEENFPRRSPPLSLDLLRGEKMYTFEPIDQDRYLFLQALFAAKEFLHVSYSHLSQEGSPLNPTPLLEEMKGSLDAPVQECKVAASERTLRQSTISWPEKPNQSLPEGEWTISLADLSSLARHPWEYYLKKTWGLRFDGPKELTFAQQKAKILKTNLQNPLENIAADLPPGICGDALKIDLDERSKEWADRIRSWDLCLEPASFKMSANERKRGEFPALSVSLGPNCHVKLVGDAKVFSTKGFVHAGSDSIEGLLRVWPECLAVLVASGRREIYCLKSGKVKTVEAPDAALEAFLVYSFSALAAPSPLLSEWADPFLRKGVCEQQKGIFEDPVFDWVANRVSLPPAAEWFGHWEELLRKTFSPLTALYPSRGKHATV